MMMARGLGIGVDLTVPARSLGPNPGEIDRAARSIPGLGVSGD